MKFHIDSQNILATGETYHIFSKSIIGKKIFPNKNCFLRFTQSIKYYQYAHPPLRLSYFLVTSQKPAINTKEKLVDNLCYCLMPNHFHLILTQLVDKGISIFINRLLNSYSRFFNTKFKRKGPLWQGRFKRVRIASDEQLLHVTRYIHLNPATSYLVENPSDYPFSSYKEYLKPSSDQITDPTKVLGEKYSSKKYQEFVLAQKDYQRKLATIKDLILE